MQYLRLYMSPVNQFYCFDIFCFLQLPNSMYSRSYDDFLLYDVYLSREYATDEYKVPCQYERAEKTTTTVQIRREQNHWFECILRSLLDNNKVKSQWCKIRKFTLKIAVLISLFSCFFIVFIHKSKVLLNTHTPKIRFS